MTHARITNEPIRNKKARWSARAVMRRDFTADQTIEYRPQRKGIYTPFC
jgi:hypothetical protein